MIHCGFVGLLGLPNVGKSSFLNFILDEDLSVVSSKPQTTRQSFSGLMSTDNFQLILLDAPGFVASQKGLFEYLNAEYQAVIKRSEHLLVLISFDQKASPKFDQAYQLAQQSGKTISFVFTKSDLPASDFVKEFKAGLPEKALSLDFSVKEKDQKTTLEFLEKVSKTLPQEHHPLYDPDLISLENTRDIVAEYIREQCFLQLSKEVPFGMGVIIKSYKKQNKLLHIEANLLVEKESHKAIVIGKQGQQLKKIGSQARKKIEEFLGEKIYLGLHVAHKKNWTASKSIMKEVGYHHDKQ